MGTRNLIAVAMNGEYKIAQYGQWDGYPGGQGAGVLGFLSSPENITKLTAALGKTRFFDAEGKDKDFIDSYNKNSPEWSSDPDNRTPEQKRWFSSYISRDLGSDILGNVANSEDAEILLKNSIGFAGDSLYCEWAYVVDLDDGVLEVYQGFNKSPVKEGRFVSGSDFLEVSKGYEPVTLAKAYRFDSLPSLDDFLSDLEPEEE